MERNTECVIVTGGQGFIGTWVTKLLLDNKQSIRYHVVIVDVKPDDHILRQVLTTEEMARIECVFIDISNTVQVAELVKKHQPSFIVHLAGLQIPTCRANPILGAQVNVIGTINVFEAVKQLDKSCPIIYASSAAVSGPSEDYDGPVGDNTPHMPLTHYGVYKQANEGTARVYWMENKIPSVGLRPFTVYGVGREVGMTSAPTKVLKSLLIKKDYVIPFSGDLCVNYVEDIANLFISLGQLPKIQGAHVCNIKGDVVTVDEWVNLVKQVEKDWTININVQGSKLPYPTDFKEDTLEKLLSGKIKTTPPIQAIQKTYQIFKSLYQQNKLDFKELN